MPSILSFRGFHHVLEGPRGQVAVDRVLEPDPEAPGQAAAAQGAASRVVDAADRPDLAVEGLDYVEHPYLRGLPREPVAALVAPLREDEARGLELAQDALEVLGRDSLGPGYLGARGRGFARPGEVDQGAYPVLGLHRHGEHIYSGIPIGLVGI